MGDIRLPNHRIGNMEVLKRFGNKVETKAMRSRNLIESQWDDRLTWKLGGVLRLTGTHVCVDDNPPFHRLHFATSRRVKFEKDPTIPYSYLENVSEYF